MWHLAPEGTPTGNAEEIARDLHTWPVDQDFPWRRRQGGLPVAPAVEGFSLAATLERQPGKRNAPFCGLARSRPPRRAQGGSGTQSRHNRCRTSGSPNFGTCPRAPWPTPTRPSRGPSRRPSPPTPPCSAVSRRERPGFHGERTDAEVSTYPWCKGRLCFTPRAWGPWSGGRSCQIRRADG